MNKKHRNLSSLNASLMADHLTKDLTESTLRVFGDTDRLRQIPIQWSKVNKQITQGRLFEQLEVTKFNTEVVKQRSTLHAATTDSIGQTNHQTTDVVIKKGRKIIKEFQLKSGNKASNTAHMLADEKYKDVKLVGPSDQSDRVKDLYNKRSSTETLKKDIFKSAASRLNKTVEAEGISSGGTTYDEALQATDANYADKVASRFEITASLSDMHQSGIEAAKIGASMSANISILTGLVDLSQNNIDGHELSARVICDTAKSATSAYLTTAGSKALVHGLAKAGASQASINVLSKSNAHVAIAAGIVKSGQSVVSYLNGNIDEKQLMNEISETATISASTFYYGALGQAIIPIPVVGALIGSTVGYFIGQILHQSGLIGLGEVAIVKAARERRENIELMCLEAIPLIRQHRIKLEMITKEHFSERGGSLTIAFDKMEKSLVSWDVEDFTFQLESINRAFGESLPFKTFEEFDRIMRDPLVGLEF